MQLREPLTAVFLCCCMVIPTMLRAQSQKIEIDPAVAAQGITLLSAESPEAAKYLGHISPDNMKRIKNLLPYSVVLVNNSPHRLLAASVTWVWKDPNNGKIYPHQTLGIEDFNDVGPVTALKSGEGRLFTTDQSLNLYFIRLKAAPERMDPNALEQFSGLVGQTLAAVSSHENFSANVDCVVLEDVGPIGPDYSDFKSRGWNRTTTYNNRREQ